jgi:hypothetical protein
VWSILVDCVPEGVPARKYGIDCVTMHGVVVGGLKGFAEHNSYFPFSGGVIGRIGRLPHGTSASKSALRFPLDGSLTTATVRRLVKVRLAEMATVEGGTRVVTFPNGRVKAVGQVRRGKLQGKWTWFRQDGSIMRSGSFRDDQPVGQWRTYDRSGRVVSRVVKTAAGTRRVRRR